MLCDGDCGNCYREKDLNLTSEGDNLCKECMFSFIWKQSKIEDYEEHLR